MVNPIQSYFDEIKSFVGASICLSDERGKVLASIDKNMIGNSLPINLVISLSCEEQVNSNHNNQYLIKKINIEQETYFLVSTSAEHDIKMVFELIAYNISSMLELSNSKNIVPLTFQQYINGQILEDQFVARLEQVQYDYKTQHAFLLVDFLSGTVAFDELLDTVIEVFDFTDVLVAFAMNNHQFAIIYQEDKEITPDDAGSMLLSLLENDLGINARVIVGPTVKSAIDILDSYVGVLAIISVSSAFDNPTRLLNYDSMIWTKLINSIPIDVAKEFVSKVYSKSVQVELGEEYRETILAFFENDLNISETSRKLFVHRNTLVYRLDKIKKLTGLDISKFEQAVKLYFTILLKQYIDIYENKQNIDMEEES